MFLCLSPVLVFCAPFIAWDLSKTAATEKYQSNAEQFWDWFASIDRDLYRASSTEDPVIKKLQSKLEELEPGLTFRLGPISGGKRELAFIDAKWDGDRAKTGSVPLSEAAFRRKLKNWLVGIGFSYEKYDDGGLEYGHGQQRISAHNKDFQCTVSRNCDAIDVTIYTDLPVYTQYGNQMPTDFFLSKNLGEELYRCYLGKVTVKDNSQIGATKTQTIDHLREMFLHLMTDSERKEMTAQISTQPVVVYVSAPRKELALGAYQYPHYPNPAMHLRRGAYH